MRKILFIFLLFFSLNLFGYNVTTFIDIPIDGTKEQMIKKLQQKGFDIVDYKKGILKGEFNGEESYIFIVTNRNKVYRICVRNINIYSEQQAIVKFNNLVKQFNNSNKYIPAFGCNIDNFIIKNTETNLWYKIEHKNKTYEASFIQVPPTDYLYELFINGINTNKFDEQYNDAIEVDSIDIIEYNKSWLNKIDYEFSDNFEYIYNDLNKSNYKFNSKYRALYFYLRSCLSLFIDDVINSNKSVWISLSNGSLIDYDYNKYYIYYYYDNLNNKSDGSDL